MNLGLSFFWARLEFSKRRRFSCSQSWGYSHVQGAQLVRWISTLVSQHCTTSIRNHYGLSLAPLVQSVYPSSLLVNSGLVNHVLCILSLEYC